MLKKLLNNKFSFLMFVLLLSIILILVIFTTLKVGVTTEVLGWTGSFLFAISAIPQAYKSYLDGHSDGISWGLLAMWLSGEVCALTYVLDQKAWPLIANYLGNIIWIYIILFYKVRPVKYENRTTWRVEYLLRYISTSMLSIFRKLFNRVK